MNHNIKYFPSEDSYKLLAYASSIFTKFYACTKKELKVVYLTIIKLLIQVARI